MTDLALKHALKKLEKAVERKQEPRRTECADCGRITMCANNGGAWLCRACH